MPEINLTFPDGTKRSVEQGITVLDVAKSIATSLAKNAVGGRLNGELVSLDQAINADASIEIVTKDTAAALDILRHTVSFVMANALHEMYPDMHFGQTAADEDGFYYDTDNEDGQVAVTDLDQITAKMMSYIKSGLKISSREVSIDEARKIFADDPYKLLLLNDVKGDQVTLNRLGDLNFEDFGDGAMLTGIGKIKYFKLLSVAGAYWEGKSSNPMLQRLYGTAFFSQQGLDDELKRQQEARERDHRVIGRDLDLFFVDPKVGAGLPYWMPNGATIRRTIERYIMDKEISNGYQHVYTPVLANLDLYKQSGHWEHYREDMFPPMDMGDGEMLELRPMNCPSHIQVYKHHIRSYRELPIRIAELGMMHRYEKSGALSGLQRVREMTLNDGHTFVMLDQIEDEFAKILRMMVEVYEDFNITDYTFRLSYRDPKNTEKYFANDEMWEKSQGMLKKAMDDLHLDYYEAEGEAAFYGPKLDVQTKTALGNDETLSTIQLDFMLPERFDLNYVGEDGQEHRPVMIHRGVVSTMERFVAYLTEIYKGAFPTWLSPQQVTIIPVKNDLHEDFSKEVQAALVKHNVRVKIDNRNEKMGYKIREAQTKKIPYTLVIGDKELNDASVSVRHYGEDESEEMPVKMFVDSIVDEINNYSRTGSNKDDQLNKKLDIEK